MKAEEIGKEFAEVAEGCASEAFRLLKEVQEMAEERGEEYGSARFMAMSERCARIASLLKVASVLDSLSLIGRVECPQCGEVFEACHHRVEPCKSWWKEASQ